MSISSNQHSPKSTSDRSWQVSSASGPFCVHIVLSPSRRLWHFQTVPGYSQAWINIISKTGDQFWTHLQYECWVFDQILVQLASAYSEAQDTMGETPTPTHWTLMCWSQCARSESGAPTYHSPQEPAYSSLSENCAPRNPGSPKWFPQRNGYIGNNKCLLKF